jgi:hypothetical protein
MDESNFDPLTQHEVTKVTWAPADDGELVAPIPVGVASPDMIHPKLGKPQAVWTYRDESGAALAYVARYDTLSGAKDKEFRPRTWRRFANGECRWSWKSYPRDQKTPLYGLERLAANDSIWVVVTEGEKCADLARRVFPKFAVVSSMGGARAAREADWSPLKGRRALIWPDHDAPGAGYAADVAACLDTLGVKATIIDAVALVELAVTSYGDRVERQGFDVHDALELWKEPDALRQAALELAKPWTPPPPPPPGPKPTKFKLIPFEDIKFFAKDEWLVKNLLPRQGVAPIFGASQGFKSFLAIDLGLHVALGWDWAGRRTKQGSVVYIAAENAAGVRKRKTGFEMAHADRLPNRVPFYLIEAAPNLGTERNDRDALIASVEAMGVAPALIVIDTLAQTLGGGEENSTGMMTFLANATALANHFKCCVIPIHHVPLADDKRMRGHTSLYAGVDALLRAERNGHELVVILWLDKLKDEEGGVGLTVRLDRIVIGHDEDDVEISTLIVASIEDGAPVQTAKGTVPKSIPRGRRLLMEVVEQAIDEAGQDFRSFADGPMVRAAHDEAVRLRYYIRIAEQADPSEDADKLAARQRQAFNRAVKAALDAKDIIARTDDDRRFLWLP